ncbi:MAG: glutamine--fructose-6-phosphate aminotransferase [isomerizing] [Candidatus Kapaibacterium sp.]|nr:MAG: glutamine--fructose-6-phosphate aminotransferase [isomerizing] [Candidatus Kapabacteria bacterium]
MCGIIGYIGSRQALPIVLEGLRNLEYRGYDSAGIAISDGTTIRICKRAGKVAQLVTEIAHLSFPGTLGIGHTRWATHGEPTDINAHPHTDSNGRIVLIHNGIIENYTVLKARLEREGYHFRTETDTEVLAVFIGMLYDRLGDFELAVRTALQEIEGTFGLAIICTDDPDCLIAARRGSPIVLGIGDEEYIVASDASAIVSHTRRVVYLRDDEMAILRRNGYVTKTIGDEFVSPEIHELDFELEQIQRGNFPHFMLKEIFEQPSTFRDSIRGRLLLEEGNAKLGGLTAVADKLRAAKRIILTGCGTSWHSALVGEYIIEHLARLPVEVEYASELRYRNPVIYPDDIVIGISQSGETIDTLAALREAKLKGATILGIVNVVGSTIARETDAGVYLHAGPEIGVASTKAFTSQLAVLTLLGLYLGRQRDLSVSQGQHLARELSRIPQLIAAILDRSAEIESIAQEYAGCTNALYLGRGVNYPVALEGALKLKEISYIHAEGYPAAEMKHGPIALIDENMPVIFLATQDEIYEKIISNIQEVKARHGRIIAIATEGDRRIASLADHVITVPATHPLLTPMVTTIPLQLLAYYIAVARGCDVDKPRNLAKSVTVE